jgi:hypothetical protein
LVFLSVTFGFFVNQVDDLCSLIDLLGVSSHIAKRVLEDAMRAEKRAALDKRKQATHFVLGDDGEIDIDVRNVSLFCPILFILLTTFFNFVQYYFILLTTYFYFQYRLLSVKYFRTTTTTTTRKRTLFLMPMS